MDTTVGMDASTPRRRFTPRARLLTIVGLGGLTIAIIRLAPLPFDNANRFLATEICSLLIGVALLIWSLQFVFTTRRSRAAVIGTVVLVVAALVASFRLDFGGDMQQRLMPRLWVRRVATKLGIGPAPIVHEVKLAKTALVIEPTADDAPSFFGPSRDGIYAARHGKLARDWAAKPPRELWRKAVGEACSSFVVVGKYGFTQEQTDDLSAELVTCYDLTDGSQQWVHADAPGYDWVLGGLGPRATPTFHQGKLYVVGSAGLFNCFEAATGKVLWKHELDKYHRGEPPMWGRSSSPLIASTKTHGDVVVVSVGGDDAHSLVAFSATDGREVWHAGDDPTGYATPQLVTLGGVLQIVIVNFQSVTGHDLETGAVLWKYDAWNGRDPKVPQTIPIDDRRLLISAGYTMGCRMLDIARNDAGTWEVKELWKAKTLKPKFMNPIKRGDYVYGIDDGAFLMCISTADGKVQWRSKRDSNYDHAQIILVDDLLIVQAETGDVALVEADPKKFNELGRFTGLPVGRTWNVPVLWGNKLVLRNNKEAACYELPTE